MAKTRRKLTAKQRKFFAPRSQRTRRSTNVAKRKGKKSHSRREKIDAMSLLARGFGSGTAGVAGALANKVFPTVAGNTAELGAGVGITYFGKGRVKQVGEGILIKAIGDLVEDHIAPYLMNMAGNVVNTSTGQTTSNEQVI